MRSDIVRIYKVVHTWTGILTGMALFIAFYAGAITLFKEPLVRWATPPAAASTTVPLAAAQTLITRTLAKYPEVAREFQINLSRTDAVSDLLEWQVHEGGTDGHSLLSARHFVATLDARDMAHAKEIERSHLAEFIDALHRVVGLPADTDLSRYFMGAIAALYFMALFSGLVILLPSLVKDLFALRVGPNLKRMWLDAHNVVGLASLPFHVVMALTAAVFAFHDPIYALQNRLIHDGKLGAVFRGGDGPAGAKPRDPSTMLPPTEIVARVTALSPGFEPTMLRYVRVTGPSPTVAIFGHDKRALEYRVLGGMAVLDPYSGRVVTAAYLPGHQSRAEIVLTSFFALHFGSFGGAPLKWVYFLLALLGAWLFYSGNLLWIESRRRKASKRVVTVTPIQRLDTRLMASMAVGVCLGAVCGISVTVVCAKWLHGHVVDLNHWHRVIYYIAFFMAIAWSFFRGGARASVDLLRVAAVATLAIPLTTFVAAMAPSLNMWAHATPGPIGVDMTALAMGLAFTWMSRRAARRVYQGPADSVWSVHTPVSRSTAEQTGTVEAAAHGNQEDVGSTT